MVHMIFLANMLYAAKRYISAEIGWYAICATLAHMEIRL